MINTNTIIMNQAHNVRETPLMEACREQDIVLVASIISTDDINKKNKHGATVLMIACAQPSIDIVKLLIKNGANVNLRDNEGRCALFYVSGYYDTDKDKVRLLIKNGANVNSQDNHCVTSLMRKCGEYKINIDIVKLYIENGADINLSDKMGGTCIMWALYQKKINDVAIKFLIEKGADLTKKNKHGESALDIANRLSHMHIFCD